MLVISSEEFTNNQQKYFDLLDTDSPIILQRGKDKAYLLASLSDADQLSTNPNLIERVKKAEQNIENGETIAVANPKNIWESIL